MLEPSHIIIKNKNLERRIYLRFVQRGNKQVVEESHLKLLLLLTHRSNLLGVQEPKLLTVKCLGRYQGEVV